jgi:uncharacterized protein YggE
VDSSSPKSNKLNFSIDTRAIIILLLVIIVAMLALWRPWSERPGANDRTISVTGKSTVKAEPDEYRFHPAYEFKNANKDAALAELTKKSDEVIKKLKELGVTDNKIKSDSSGNNYDFFYDSRTRENRYSLRLTVTVDNKEHAQKVQDYLVTTAPTGNISPQATFSENKRKELEAKARDEATKDARNKADQSAKNIGFKVGGVKSVDDGAGFGGIEPYYGRAAIALDMAEGKPDLAVQPGENELNYSVTVVYFVK